MVSTIDLYRKSQKSWAGRKQILSSSSVSSRSQRSQAVVHLVRSELMVVVTYIGTQMPAKILETLRAFPMLGLTRRSRCRSSGCRLSQSRTQQVR